MCSCESASIWSLGLESEVVMKATRRVGRLGLDLSNQYPKATQLACDGDTWQTITFSGNGPSYRVDLG